jgi:hypothetical protein
MITKEFGERFRFEIDVRKNKDIHIHIYIDNEFFRMYIEEYVEEMNMSEMFEYTIARAFNWMHNRIIAKHNRLNIKCAELNLECSKLLSLSDEALELSLKINSEVD